VRRIAVLVILAVAFAPAMARAAEWYEKLKLRGDVRFRNEAIQQEGKADNFRWRIRARLAADADVTEAWSVTIGLSTGSDDPVSTNQTLTNGFSRKPIETDLAYVDFHPPQVPGMSADAGKMRFPFETADKTQLLWDNDLTPEGIALRYKHAAGPKAGIFANAAGFYLTDNDPDNEQWMWGAQGGFNAKASDNVSLMVGAAYFSFEKIKGMPGIYKTDKFFGNTTTKSGTTNVFAQGFKEFEALAVLDAKVNGKASFRFAGDYVNNTAADSLNTGYLVEGVFSYGKDRGSLKLGADYRMLESDAVMGFATYSDFVGGGTDGKGWQLVASFGLAKGASFDVTYLLDKKNIADGETELDYHRLQVDVLTKF
jgi:hypothetical protein